MKLDNFHHLEYSYYWPHLYCFTHNVSTDMSFVLLQVFHVKLRSPHRNSNWTLCVVMLTKERHGEHKKFNRKTHEVPLISFQAFFLQAFKIVVDSWKFNMLLLYILWDDWPIFMISGSNEQLYQQLECTQLKPDCHSWWISKMQSGHEDILEERYAIKLSFKLGKNATETYGMLQTVVMLTKERHRENKRFCRKTYIF